MHAETQRDLFGNDASHGLRAALRAFLLCPGFSAVTRYRWAHKWHRSGRIARFASRLCWLSNTRAFGCYMAPSARIGAGLILPHPVAVVIGEGSVIEEDVTIYQGVTLGRKSALDERYPHVESGVTIYAGATLLGPVRIGRGAVIAAHAVVMTDVPAGAIAVGAPARIAPPRRQDEHAQALSSS